jgi:putative membrane protein
MTYATVRGGCTAALLAIAWTLSAQAANEPTSQQFVTKAAQSNLAEIKASQLALTKTQNPDVRKFAQQMIDDHTKANEQLTSVAEQKHLKVPDDTDVAHRADMKMLEAKSGASFDKSYIERMNKDHDKTIKLFQEAQNDGKLDPELKSLVAKMLPTLESHHHEVTRLASSETGSTNR